MKFNYRLFLTGLLVTSSVNVLAYPDCKGLKQNLDEIFKPRLNVSKIFKGKDCQVEVSKTSGHYTEDVKLVVVNLLTKGKATISTGDCGPMTWRSTIDLNPEHLSYHASESGLSREYGGFYEKKWLLDILHQGESLDINLENHFFFRGVRGGSLPVNPNVNLKLSCEIQVP